MADPLWINASAGSPAYNAAELRQAMALALMYGGRAMGARQGVRPGGTQMQVSLAGSTITVRAGVACVDPGLTTPQGPYWVALPADEAPVGGPLAAADATNPRKDIVILRVYDTDEDSSGLRTARSEYIAGTASASPSEPAVPAGAIRLATIDVPKSGGGAPAVTDRRPFVVGSGGLLPVRDQAERDALSAYAGLQVYRMDLRRVELHDGSGWRIKAAATAAYVTPGTATWSKPLGARSVWVRCQGGGGAGGGAASTSGGGASMGGGGGGGCYSEVMVDADTLPASVTVTVGDGGAGVAGDSGGSGGTSSFGTWCSASGGTGGFSRTTSTSAFGVDGGSGGGTATGDIRFEGGSGMGGWGDNQLGFSGAGGSSHMGGGGRGLRTTTSGQSYIGGTGNYYGGGGGGSINSSSVAPAIAGAAGARGAVVVVVFF